ncbi:MAG: hypothetical protein Q8M34_05745 [Thermodesulfovibrionales bacterium]|nr:hypothetical protein [Thermodesulfovibrionales bacterium]
MLDQKIQELERRIESLEHENSECKKKISDLEATVKEALKLLKDGISDIGTQLKKHVSLKSPAGKSHPGEY